MKFIKKNIINLLFVALLLAIVFVPETKAFLLKGLIKTGLYSPKLVEQSPVEINLKGISFSDIKGNIINLGDLKGKVIFLNFWATWCPPCRAEMPSINILYKKFKSDPNYVFIFADADGDLQKSIEFMISHKYELPVFKIESNVPEQIFKSSLPTTIIFDKQGRISFKHEGMADYSDEKIIEFMKKLKASEEI